MIDWFRKLLTRASLENPQVPISAPNVHQWVRGAEANAFGNVSLEDALREPTVRACVNVIGETIASLPLHVYRDDGGESEARDEWEGYDLRAEKATKLPLYRLLHDQPNPGTTSYRWRRLVMQHLLTRGRHITRVEFNGRGKPVGLYPLNPQCVTVERIGGVLRYIHQPVDGAREVLDASEVLHFVWELDDDGIDGVSPISRMAETIGLSLALQRFGAAFFANGARPGIVLEYPGALSQDGIERLRSSIESTHGGVGKSFKVMVMENGAKLHTVTLAPEQSQFVEARKMQKVRIAEGFRVPPTFLQDLEHGTYSNTEQQDLAFVKHTIRPWVTMLEQEMTLKLLPSRGYSVRFNLDGLLRGDFKTRMEGMAVGIQNGVLKPNEGRAYENRPPVEYGDELWIQGATVPMRAQITGDPDESEPTDPA